MFPSFAISGIVEDIPSLLQDFTLVGEKGEAIAKSYTNLGLQILFASLETNRPKKRSFFLRTPFLFCNI